MKGTALFASLAMHVVIVLVLARGVNVAPTPAPLPIDVTVQLPPPPPPPPPVVVPEAPPRIIAQPTPGKAAGSRALPPRPRPASAPQTPEPATPTPGLPTEPDTRNSTSDVHVLPGGGSGDGAAGTGGGEGGKGGGGGTRPVPLDADRYSSLPYTREATLASAHGDVRVGLVVTAQGTVDEPTLVHGIGFGLDEIALRAIVRFHFRPATDAAGRPVAARIVWTFHFQPKGR